MTRFEFLKDYVDSRNGIMEVIDEPLYSLDSYDDMVKIQSIIVGELEPEALTADGELPESEVRTKRTYYKALLVVLNERLDELEYAEELAEEIQYASH